MDFVQSSSLKSLKETLLEYAVLNMELLLPHGDVDPLAQNNDAVRNSIPEFPALLFDQILDKSVRMCWTISDRCLTTCFLFRERLKWNDLSHFGDLQKVCACYQTLFLRALSPLRCFSSDAEGIEFLADRLIYLDAKVWASNLYINHFKTRAWPRREKTKTENGLALVHLKLDTDDLALFPFTLDSQELKVLELGMCTLDWEALEFLAGLRNLRKLSLLDVKLDGPSVKDLTSLLATLGELRVLSVWLCDVRIDTKSINRLLTGLGNLETLELNSVRLGRRRLIVPRRRLKALIFYVDFDNRDAESTRRLDVKRLTTLAEKVGNFESLDGLLTICEHSAIPDVFDEAFEILNELDMEATYDSEVRSRLEKQFVRASKKDLFRTCYMYTYTGAVTEFSRFSFDFLLKMACTENSKEIYQHRFTFFDGIMAKYVESNRNGHLAKKFTKILNGCNVREV